MKVISLALALLLVASCGRVREQPLTKEFVAPASGYSQAVVTEHNGVKTIHISGQVGEGGDLAAQMRGALEGIEQILTENDASFKDVVKMNHYIVDYQPEDLAVFRATRKDIMGDEDMPASTLVGVTSLFAEGYLIEIDAVAICKSQ